jgi:hypothetical protein
MEDSGTITRIDTLREIIYMEDHRDARIDRWYLRERDDPIWAVGMIGDFFLE